MFTYKEIEEIILGMADIVLANRFLREENERLTEELEEKNKQSRDRYEESQKMTANLLSAFLSNSHARMGDVKTAEAFANQINTKEDEDNHVEFISYTGKFPNACSGVLTLKIDGEIVTFDRFSDCFWSSGGNCNTVTGDIQKGRWIIDKNELPEKYRQYADEIDRVFNENIPWGCCGGCI